MKTNLKVIKFTSILSSILFVITFLICLNISFEWFDINKAASAAEVFEKNMIQFIGNTGIMSVEKMTSISEYVGISVLFDKIDFITPQYLLISL